MLSASTCCSSISQRLSYLRTPYVPAPSIEKYLRPSVGLASVRVAATLLARYFQWRILFVSDHVIWFSKICKAEKVFVAELEIRQMYVWPEVFK